MLEGTWGFIRNQGGAPIVTDKMNRCNVGLCDIPFLFPDFGVVRQDYVSVSVVGGDGTCRIWSTAA